MIYNEVLERIIDDGIEAARRDYGTDDKLRLDGSIAGFEACRSKNVNQLGDLLLASQIAARDARLREAPDYWWFRCYELEVEWVCNCVSARLLSKKLPTIVDPTCRGMMKAAEVVGVTDHAEVDGFS